MAKPQNAKTGAVDLTTPLGTETELAIAANQIVAASGSGANPYEMRNQLIIEEKKERIRYKNGYTLPASVQALRLDAQREVRHSRILATNIKKANPPGIRPKKADAHHIVAQEDARARQSRFYLFNWGIGINDADNGIFLPRFPRAKRGSIANAAVHQTIHTDLYHFTVTARLLNVAKDTMEIGRKTLRKMRAELMAGTFPY
ncbi:MAG: hypothetical protein HC872_00330 [Gammaproteobacteria bacterium]|nr:hypothetical protein [Gammaproteobacteria bacterium]